MKHKIFLFAALSAIALPFVNSGCERTVKEDKKVTVHDDGSTKTQETKVTQEPDGSTRKTEETKKTPPEQ